jgi:hypothetical protein
VANTADKTAFRKDVSLQFYGKSDITAANEGVQPVVYGTPKSSAKSLLNKASLSNRESASCRRICAVRSLNCDFWGKGERSLIGGQPDEDC